MIPRVVPEEGLLAANSLGQATRMVAGVIGAAVTGVIAATAGAAWPVLVVDAGTFLVSVVLVIGVGRELGRPDAVAAAKAKTQGLGGAVADGLRLIGRSAGRSSRRSAACPSSMLGIGAINVLFIPFLITDLGASPAWAGPLEAAQTVSMILAGGLMVGLASRFSVPRLFVGGLVGLAVCVGLLAIVPGPWALLVIMFAVGWFVMPVQATTMTIVQKATDERDARPGRRCAERGDPDGVDRVDGGRRHPRRRDRHPGGVRDRRRGRAARRGRRLVPVPRRDRGRAERDPGRRLSASLGITTAPASRPAPFACLRSTGTRSAAAPVAHGAVEPADHRPVVAMGLVRVHQRPGAGRPVRGRTRT